MTDNGTARILVVCTGNVCRSPYIERRLQGALDASWEPGAVKVVSAGTGALVGHPMDQRAAERLATWGAAAHDFTARQIDRELIASAQLVVTATRAHRTAVSRRHPRALKTTHALRDLALLSEQITPPSPNADMSPEQWFDLVVPLLAAQRGIVPPLPDDDVDVIDPFRRDGSVFDLMVDQIESCLPPIVRLLGRPSGG